MGTIRSILFVSRSLIQPSEEGREIELLLTEGKDRNAALDVTGALIFTHRHFAEILEGPPGSIETLMHSIRRDPRHCDLRIVEDLSVERRAFTRWAMAYRGPASYVSKRVAPLLDAQRPELARALRSLICALAEDA